MATPLRLLIVEDSQDDAGLIGRIVEHGGYAVTRQVVETEEGMRAALGAADWDVITSDHAMPHFSAPAALRVARELRPDLPFIIVSGEIDLNLAVSLMKAGAHDYVQKGELARLVPTIERELREVALRDTAKDTNATLAVSEIRYRRLFETAQDGILILDADSGEITDVNPFLIDLLGYPREHFLGRRLWELGGVQDEQASRAAFDALQANGYVRYEDLPLQTSDGQRVDVEFVSNVYLVHRQRVAQCNIRNISARVEADSAARAQNAELERRVDERTAQLESVNRELETFNYSVSHDLQAPLRRILDLTGILREQGAEQSATGREIVHSIRAAVERMNALIDALLDLARFSQRDLDRRPVDLSSMVRRIALELQQSQPERPVEFVVQDGVSARGETQLLRMVVQTLMNNAWKFTGRHATARIEFGSAKLADGTTEYFVRDDGAGFEMANSERLFGAFQRLHSEKEFPGLGIGLATVRRIVHRHGGHVWAEGAVERGATIHFTVGAPPAAAAPAARPF